MLITFCNNSILAKDELAAKRVKIGSVRDRPKNKGSIFCTCGKKVAVNCKIAFPSSLGYGSLFHREFFHFNSF